MHSVDRQLDMTWPPRTHSTDPASSHRAEQRCRESGRMASQMNAVERLLRFHTGRTASELALIARRGVAGLSNDFHECRQQIRRRLTDLKNAGRARRQYTPGEKESRWFHAGE